MFAYDELDFMLVDLGGFYVGFDVLQVFGVLIGTL